MTTAVDVLSASRVALLTTFRKNGNGVATPVGLSVKDGRAYFTTRAKTWKVKRLAADPRVSLAPCTKTGKVLGDTVEGTARLLDDTERRAVVGGFEYRVWALIYRVFYRDVPITYEVALG